jgi:hypothetical protein
MGEQGAPTTDREAVQDRIALTGLAVAAVVSTLSVVGWLLGIRWLAAVIPGTAPAGPNAMLAVMGLTAVLAVGRYRHGLPVRLVTAVVCGYAVLVAAAALSGALGGPGTGVAGAIIDGGKLPDVDVSMSLPLALGVLLIAIVTLLSAVAPGSWRLRLVLAVLTLATAAVPFLGSLYSAEAIVRPLGLRALAPAGGIALLALGSSTAATALAPRWWQLLLSQRPAGIILRRLLPITLATLVLIGYPRLLGERLGLYDLGFGTALMVVANGFVIGVMLVRTARQLDVQQLRAEAEERAARGYQEILRRQAIELNDEVIQGLSAAWLALQLGRGDTAAKEIQRATHQAQRIASEQLQASGQAGTDIGALLTRTTPSGQGSTT